MFVLQYGAERIAKGLSLAGGSGDLYWEPLTGVVVRTEVGWILLDTGMSRVALEDPANQAAYEAAARGLGADVDAGEASGDGDGWHLWPAPPDPRRWNWGRPGNPLEDALAGVGLAPGDLALAAVSHLHLDHSGGIPTLAAAGVPVAIQAAELDFARSGRPGLGDGYHAPDWSDPRTRWELLDGDSELAPGVRALATPGHTPGHTSFRVDLRDTGTWIFAGDAADLVQNLYDRVPPGSCAGGTPADEKAAAESLERLLAEGRRHDARLVPGHDQVLFNAIRHPTQGHT
jgi:glyoxylase-like metal-dependent hydrolase (beta-lactamase superfamily II)